MELLDELSGKEIDVLLELLAELDEVVVSSVVVLDSTSKELLLEEVSFVELQANTFKSKQADKIKVITFFNVIPSFRYLPYNYNISVSFFQ